MLGRLVLIDGHILLIDITGAGTGAGKGESASRAGGKGQNDRRDAELQCLADSAYEYAAGDSRQSWRIVGKPARRAQGGGDHPPGVPQTVPGTKESSLEKAAMDLLSQNTTLANNLSAVQSSLEMKLARKAAVSHQQYTKNELDGLNQTYQAL
jgi:hypothetical protein